MKEYKLYIVSNCLLGSRCRYDGESAEDEKVLQFIENKKVIAVCPEISGELGVPRKPCEISNAKEFLKGEKPLISSKDGENFTREFERGSKACMKSIGEKILQMNLEKEDVLAILKDKSPSCGSKFIYDGSFQKRLIEGIGIFAKALKDENIDIISESELK